VEDVWRVPLLPLPVEEVWRVPLLPLPVEEVWRVPLLPLPVEEVWRGSQLLPHLWGRLGGGRVLVVGAAPPPR
jgi:hypothetical protein